MFTGIITGLGSVRRVTEEGDRRIEIFCPFNTGDINIGASISCSGACMTVIEKGPNWFAISASKESLSKTTIGEWAEGTKINLERALRAGDEMGGHIVSGHVDDVGYIRSIEFEGSSTLMVLEAPSLLSRLIVPKGSISVDGVSLTVNDVSGSLFGINVIPHTKEVTTLGDKKVGDLVNLEIDMLARYVAKLYEVPSEGSAG